MGKKQIAHSGYVRKYEVCPHCGCEHIVYTFVVCCNGSVQYKMECPACRAMIPVPHIENIDKNRIEQNRRSAWAYEVKEHDGFACRLCGSTEGLEAHHIVPWDADPGQRFNPKNGITLCRLHHDRIHTWRKNHGEE